MQVYQLYDFVEPTATLTLPQRHVLIVDDDNLVRETLRFVLEDSGYQVHAVSSGADALNILEREPIDIVLSDIFMPGMNGFNILHQFGNAHQKRL